MLVDVGQSKLETHEIIVRCLAPRLSPGSRIPKERDPGNELPGLCGFSSNKVDVDFVS